MIEGMWASMAGLLALGAGTLHGGFALEFVSPRFFYDLFAKETVETWKGGPPEVGWLYVAVGLFYLAILIYFLWRFRFLDGLRAGWAESRLRKADLRASRAERRQRLQAAEQAVSGVSYDSFHLLAAGNRAFDEGRYEEALRAYEEAGASSTPRLAAAWVGRGAVLGRLGRHREAREAFGQALSLDPANSEARVNLGLTALALGDARLARQAFEQAVETDGDSSRGHYGLALLAAAEGDRAEALARLKRALSLRPSLADVAAREPAFSALAQDPCGEALFRHLGNGELRQTG